MKLIIKNLKQKQYDVEIESDKKTVGDLKMAIEEKYKFDHETLKLLHNGVILEDKETLEHYNIKDQNVLIVMNTRVKSNVPHEIPPDNLEPTTPKYPNYDPQIDALEKAGYPRFKAEKAVYAARGSMELAVEYLNRAGIYPKGEDPPGKNLPEDLKKNASIIKVVCQRDPNKILTILDNMKIHNPQLIEKMKQNEEDFKEYLVAPISVEDMENFREFQNELRQGGPGGPSRRPGQIEIRLTKEESDAIKRLKELTNCSQGEVIQAYLACDKNEELAANYLFEQKMNDEQNDNNPGPGQ